VLLLRLFGASPHESGANIIHAAEQTQPLLLICSLMHAFKAKQTTMRDLAFLYHIGHYPWPKWRKAGL
jgi:hypothetical protein